MARLTTSIYFYATSTLVERKKAGEELDRGPKIPIISAFVERELERLSGENPAPPAASSDPARLDQLFRDAQVAIWGPNVTTEKFI